MASVERRVFRSTAVSPNGHQVHFFGIIHGRGGIGGLRKNAARIISKFFDKHNPVIFAEKADNNYLPPGHQWATSIQPSQYVDFRITSARQYVEKERAIDFASLRGIARLPERKLERKIRRQFLLGTHYDYEPKRAETLRVLGLAANLQSYLMTCRLLDALKHVPKSRRIAVVTGRGHTLMIKRFLQEPELLERYGRMVKHLYRKKGDEDMLAEIEAAEKGQPSPYKFQPEESPWNW